MGYDFIGGNLSASLKEPDLDIYDIILSNEDASNYDKIERGIANEF